MTDLASAMSIQTYLPANVEVRVSVQLLRDVCWLNRATMHEDGKLDTVVLASKLVNMGYKVSIRTAVGGGSGQDCFHNLHHEFLIVSVRQQQLIVDCTFKDQFKICQQTDQYAHLLQQLPQVFVGSASRLLPMVELMCTEIALSFKESGFTCPPWRHAKSMSSKWFPTKSHDRLISHSSVSSQAKSTSSSGSISDDDFVALLECVSPEGPLVPYSEAAVMQWMKTSSQPRTTTTGFRVRSLLSSGLAATSVKSASSATHGWHEPAIRTVKMTGRQQVA